MRGRDGCGGFALYNSIYTHRRPMDILRESTYIIIIRVYQKSVGGVLWDEVSGRRLKCSVHTHKYLCTFKEGLV